MSVLRFSEKAACGECNCRCTHSSTSKVERFFVQFPLQSRFDEAVAVSQQPAARRTGFKAEKDGDVISFCEPQPPASAAVQTAVFC
jgi:hypothetical protein